MSILAMAEKDLATTLESTRDFGKVIHLTDPYGTTAEVTGQFGDIHALITLEEEIPVNVNLPHITLRLSTLREKGFCEPMPTENTNQNPWRITVDDITGDCRMFKLKMSKPDRTLGVVTAIIEPLEDV